MRFPRPSILAPLALAACLAACDAAPDGSSPPGGAAPQPLPACVTPPDPEESAAEVELRSGAIRALVDLPHEEAESAVRDRLATERNWELRRLLWRVRALLRWHGDDVWNGGRGTSLGDPWIRYCAGVVALQEGEKRDLVRTLFVQCAFADAKGEYGPKAQDLADQLARMEEEDRAWVEPADPAALAGDALVAYLIHHLRDCAGQQWGQPGMCSVLSPERARPNAADRLVAIGEPAVPALAALLEDDRPTRSVGYWRDFHPTRTVLRHRDAAIEVIDKIVPERMYDRSSTGSYLSTETPAVQATVIARVRRWVDRGRHQGAADRMWESIADAPLNEVLRVLRELAKDPGQREKVLDEARRRYAACVPMSRPRWCVLLADLGDTSNVADVLRAFRAGEYTTKWVEVPGDPAALPEAEDACEALESRYGATVPR